MRNKHNNRILGRNATERGYLLKGLTSALLEHGAITTTEAKAKELRKHVEPLITRAKQELTLANRRLLLGQLQGQDDLESLVKVGKANAKRPGGYVRLTRLPSERHDNAPVTRVEIIDFT